MARILSFSAFLLVLASTSAPLQQQQGRRSAPRITSKPSGTAVVGATYSYDVQAADRDPGETLTFSLQKFPAGAAIDSGSGLIRWTPDITQVGVNPFEVVVRDSTGLTGKQAFDVFARAVLKVDPPQSPTSEDVIVLTGIASDPRSSVRIEGGAQIVEADVAGDQSFETRVALVPDGINHLFVTEVSFQGVESSPVPVDVIHDTRPPELFIDFPPDGAALTLETTDVTGRVGDMLSGFQDISVKVNDVQAEVDEGIGTNGTFLARDVPLEAAGVPTLIEAVATDVLGNRSSMRIMLLRAEIPADQPRMEIENPALSNGQVGLVENELPNPLRVRVLRGNGDPFANKIVTFEVVRSDGTLRAVPLQSGDSTGPARRLQARTNGDGIAEVFWTLGVDAGCGNNRVSVTSADVAGSVFFCASALSAAANQINVGAGGNQVAEAGGIAPQRLVAWVSDGRNQIPGVDVVFTVTEGGGLVDAQTMSVVRTDATGHASVEFQLGPDHGNNAVVATFPGNPGALAGFQITGLARQPQTQTSFQGLVLDNSDRPIQGARVTLTVSDTVLPAVETDLDGQFLIGTIPVTGSGHIFIDGLAAFHVGGATGVDVPIGSFPALEYLVVVVPETRNVLPTPVKLPPLEPLNAHLFDGSTDLELTIRTRDESGMPVPAIEGLKMTVPRGTRVELPDGTVVDHNDPKAAGASVTLALNQVHFDEIPMPMPDGAAPPFAWTLQPAGAHFHPPLAIQLPNMAGLAPGAICYFLSFDHASNRFEIVSTGSVSTDGQFMVSDPGDGIDISGWGGFCPPYPPRGDVEGPGDGDDDPDQNNEDEEPPTKDPPSTTPDAEGGCGSGGDDDGIDPVYFFSGEYYQSVVDLRIKGRGMDFVWARKYRSKIGANTLQGNGWDCSYNISIQPVDDDILLCDGNSRQDVYRMQEDGTWAKKGFFRTLSLNPDGSYTLLFANTGQWNFHALDGSPRAGRIASIVDRNGNTIAFDYDALGRLETIHDTLDTAAHNRDIRIVYDADGFIESVTDFKGRQVRYEYYRDGDAGGASGDLKSVRSPIVVGTPHGNDYPTGKTTVYTYSTGHADERLNHNLLTITDPKGETYLRNTYAASVDPAAFEFDRIVRQVWGNPLDIIDLTYVDLAPSESNGSADVKVILNDRVGNVKEYIYDEFNRGIIEREYTGRADPDSPTTESVNRPTGKLRPADPDFFETRYSWNGNSLLTDVIHPNGNQSHYIYEIDLDENAPPRSRANLRVYSRTGPPISAADPDQFAESIVELYEYDDDFGAGCCGTNFVTRHVDGRGHSTFHEYDMRGNRTRTRHRIASIVEDWEYNEFGQMTAHVLPDNGSGHRRRDEYTYYASGSQRGYREHEIVDAGGFALTTSHEYDQVGNVVRVVDPRGHDTQFVVNDLDQVVRRTSREVTEGSGVRYDTDTFYDANDNEVRIDIRNVAGDGSVVGAHPELSTFYDYDILNYPTRMCQESGSHTVPLAQLDCSGLPPSEFITTEYGYDANRNRILVRHGEASEGRQPANTETTLYDERDLVFRVIRGVGSPEQSTNQFDYDGNANLTAMNHGVEDDPRVTGYSYDVFNRRINTRDPMGNDVLTSYDENHNVAQQRSEGQTLDAPGAASNVRLSESLYVYDPMDRLVREEMAFFDTLTQAPLAGGQASGKTISVTEYSDNSQVLRTVNDNGHERLFVYDRANRLSTETDAKGNVLTYGYDANSNATSVTELARSDVGGPDEMFTTSMLYDGVDRLVREVDNVGNTTTHAYDSRSNRTLTIDALAHETARDYDSLNRLVATIYDLDDDGPDGDDPDIVVSQSWDDTSRLIGQMDDNGNRTAYAYDALDRRIVTQMADETLHLVGTGTVIWPVGNPRPTDLGGFTPGFDVHDNQVLQTDANGSVVTCSYDLLDRLSTKSIAVGPGVSTDTTFESYSHDGLSRIVSASDDDSLVTRGYDSLSHVTRETLNGETTTCTFDGVGNQVSCTYPSGRVITCSFDELERKKTITDATVTGSPQLIASYHYVGPDRVARRDYGNGTRCSYTYDGIAGIHNPAGDFGVKQVIATHHVHDPEGAETIVDSRTYLRDPLYNKTQRKDVRVGGLQLTHDYQYDSIYRLVGTTVTDASAAIVRNTDYGLDGVGNRTQVTGQPDPGVYTCVPADCAVNQHTTTPFDTRMHDANGNLKLIDDGLPTQRTLSYDYQNRMVEVVDLASGERHVYVYDAFGRRIVRTMDADGMPGQTHYFFDGDQIVEEQDAAGAMQATYAYGSYIDEVLQMQRSGVQYFIHCDDLYNAMAITNVAGSVLERYDYLDYGAPKFFDGPGVPLESSGVLNPYLFTGRRWDSETEWYFYRTRYTTPSGGRFTTRDTRGVWSDKKNIGNAYTYVGNNPWTYTDPFGEQVNIPGVPPVFCPVVPPIVPAVPPEVPVEKPDVKPPKNCSPCPPGESRFCSQKGHWPCTGSHYHFKINTGQGPPPACKCSYREVTVCVSLN